MPQDDTDNGPLSKKSLRYNVSLRKRRDRRAVHDCLRSDKCYRTSLTEHIDVEDHRRWCMGEDVPCDVCRMSHEEAILPKAVPGPLGCQSSGADILARDRLRQHNELALYQDTLPAMRGLCVLCRAKDYAWDHVSTTCPHRQKVFQAQTDARRRSEANGRSWLNPFSACFWCLNPQSICHRAGSDSGQERHGCEFPDVVLPLCYEIFISLQRPLWIEEQCERSFNNEEEYLDWLGEQTEFGGGKAIQPVKALRCIQC